MEVIPVIADAKTFTCSAYLVLDERTVLVDAGMTPGVEDVIAEHTDDPNAVVVTHQHSDHIDEPSAVVGQFNPDVYAYIDHPFRTHKFRDGDHVKMGDGSFEMIYTPGHTDDRVSLMSGRSLFSGDVFVYSDGAFDDGNFGHTGMPRQSRERLISGLHTLLDRLPLTVEALYAGHGNPFENEAGDGTAHDALEHATERAERREPKYPEA